MNKELFKAIMSQLEENDANTNILNEALEKMTGENPWVISVYGNNDSTLYKILNFFYSDTVLDTISYFVCELDYGRKYVPGCVTEPGGTAIELKTVDQLYNLCEETQRNIEKEKN